MTYRRLLLVLALMVTVGVQAQINTEQVVNIGRNALYFEDYILAIQYFNQAIKAKPFLAEPYFFRSVAKISLEDYQGAEQDASAIRLSSMPIRCVASRDRIWVTMPEPSRTMTRD